MYCYGPKRDDGSRPIFLKLPGAVQMWPTPRAEGHDAGGTDPTRSLYVAVRDGLWPTPDTHMGHHGGQSRNASLRRLGKGQQVNLGHAVAIWPTPASRDYRHPNATSYAERGGGTKGEQLPNAVGGALSPDWVEKLLGLPVGWTDLGAPTGKTASPA